MRFFWIFLVLAVSLCPGDCLAAEGAQQDAAGHGHGLTVIDWAIIAAYAASTLALGAYYSRRQRSTEEYFIGTGALNPVLVGVSLFATLLSTISYLSMPGESLGKGPGYMTSMLAYPLVFLFVGFLLIPVYMKQRVTSAYELLEARLGVSVRLLGATMFVVLRLVWMSLLVYLTAKAMTIMLGVGEEWIPAIVLVTGLVAVTYTSMGGLQAVVITDLLQTILLYGGALLVLAVVTVDLGGFQWFPTAWHDNWDKQPLLPETLKTRVSVVGSVLTFLVWYVCTSGGDQTSVQRFMATKDASAARRALAIQLTVSVIVGVTLGLVGFALLGYYEANPELMPKDMALKKNADDVFPHFIAFQLPVGVSGLVVAAMFAAAMSSIDSGVNSITAVVMTDYVDRFRETPISEKHHVRVAKWLAFSIGAVVVVGSSFMEYVPGNITAVTQKTSNLLTTPIFCLFFFALFVRFATPLGVWIGAICGTLTAAVIAFSGPLVLLLATQFGVDPATFGTEIVYEYDLKTCKETISVPDPISFQWIAPMAVAANIGAGTLASFLFSLGKKTKEPSE
jgi:SSS family solute:Na+ symporter